MSKQKGEMMMNDEMDRYNSIINKMGLFKLIAACIIVIHHYILSLDISLVEQSEILLLFKNYGWIPTDYFFFSSGFCIIKYEDAITRKEIDIVEFLKRRLKGFYGLYLISLCMYVTVNYSINHNYRISYWKLIKNICLLHTGIFKEANYIDPILGATWFLSPLVFSYFVFYIVSMMEKQKRIIIKIVLVFIGIISIGNQFCYPIFNTWMMRGVTAFFIGILYADYVKKSRKNNLSVSIFGFFFLFFTVRWILMEEPQVFQVMIVVDILIPFICNIFANSFWKSTKSKELSEVSKYVFFLHIPIIQVCIIRSMSIVYTICLVLIISIIIMVIKKYVINIVHTYKSE